MAWLRALLPRSMMERELDEELRYHIEQQTDQNIRLEMSPEEARCSARKPFGHPNYGIQFSSKIYGLGEASTARDLEHNQARLTQRVTRLF